MRFLKQVSHSVLSALIVFQVGVGIPVYASGAQLAPITSKSTTRPENVSADYPKKLVNAYGEVLLGEYPLLGEFLKAPPLPPEMNFSISQNDPVVDKDPFFLRSQKWQPNSNPIAKGFSYQQTDQGLEISFSSWNQKLVIDADLNPVLETDDYLLLSAKEGSDIFTSRSPELKGQDDTGLFFISKVDLLAQGRLMSDGDSQGVTPGGVPIFFIPLAGNDWYGDLNGFEWLISDGLIVYSQNNVPTPIPLNEIEALEKASRVNMMVGQTIALYNSSTELRSNLNLNSGLAMPLPAVGSTAGFGLFLTGMTPDLAQFTQADNKYLRYLLDGLQLIVGAKAHADIGDFMSLLTPDAWRRVSILVGILVGTGVVSAIIRQKVYREEFKNRYGDHHRFSKKWMIEKALGFFDVYAHSLATVHYGVGLAITTSFEYLLDRYFTKWAGPKDGMIRKIFDATWGWTRKTSKDLALNHYTLWLGAIVLGMSDSIQVVFQLLFVTPWIVAYLGYAAHAAANAQYVTSEIIRNFFAYLKTGAFSYSEDQKFLVQDEVQNIVDTEMRRSGLDPFAKKNQALRHTKFEELLNQRMVQMGLPDRSQFLFDHNVLVEKIAEASGFSIKGAPDSKEEFGHYLLKEGRWGLHVRALNLAYKTAERLQTEAPSEVGAATVKAYRWMLERNSKVSSAWANLRDKVSGKTRKFNERIEALKNSPQEYLNGQIDDEFLNPEYRSFLQQSKDVKTFAAMSSYSGTITPDHFKSMPQSIKNVAGSPLVLEMMFKFYNTSLYSIVDGEPERNRPTADMQKEFKESALKDIASQSTQRPELKDSFVNRFYTLHAISDLFDRKKHEAEIQNYVPEKSSWYARKQEYRAAKIAAQAMLDGRDANWAYTKEIGKETGLYLEDPDNSEFVNAVLERVNVQAESVYEQPKEIQYMNGLLEEDKRLYKAKIFSEIFLATYAQMSLLSYEHLPALSPEQPGYFQAQRKKLAEVLQKPEPKNPGWLNWRKNLVGGQKFFAKVTTPVLRILESPFTSTPNPYRPGLVAKFQRNVPFVYSFFRVMKANLTHSLLPYATFNFLSANYIWQLGISYPIWLMAFFLNPWAQTMVEWNNQMNRNIGWKPMGSTKVKLVYGTVHSWLTFWTFIPMLMYAQPFSNWWVRNIEVPIGNVMGPVANGAEHIIGNCARFLGM